MISQERLKEALTYSKRTGLFRWKRTGSGRKLGLVAGTVNDNGYVLISIESKIYRAHILAFVYVDGAAPPNDVDHINGVRTDNSFKNLRCVTRSENLKNSSIRSDNKSGVVGVSWAKEKGKWCVRIGTDAGYKNLGYFKDKERAIKKRKEAEIIYGYHKNHGKNTRI